jgi:dihydroorotase
LDKLAGFAAEFGRKFYKVDLKPEEGKIVMIKKGVTVKQSIGGDGGDAVVPFRAGEKLAWDVIWVET